MPARRRRGRYAAGARSGDVSGQKKEWLIAAIVIIVMIIFFTFLFSGTFVPLK